MLTLALLLPLADDGFALPSVEVTTGGERVGEAIGGATGFVEKYGFFTEAALGGFFRIGGFDDEGPVATSDAQPFVAMRVGYDVLPWLALQLELGAGHVAGAAIAPETPRDYALASAGLGVTSVINVYERVGIALSVGGGGCAMAPSIDGVTLGATANAGVGVRLSSLLPNTSIGADVLWHGAFFAESIHSFSIAPVIKYTF